MGRKKINIREIENSRQKTVTFARRRAGLIKKAHELSILCGVKVAVVIFDSKNASHVYSSADTPEELFTRYLNKQFLTNESRKRKDMAESSSEDNGGGTYGFDNNGSFVRRRLAVVNEYRVTSDGPNSRNLHVKYTKQYHNPSSNLPIKRQSTASASSSTTTHERSSTAMHSSSPLSALTSLNDPAFLPKDELANLHEQAVLSRQLMCGLPARSASLFKRGLDAMANPDSGFLPFGQAAVGEYAAPLHGLQVPMSGVDIGHTVDAQSADSLKNATHNLSTLSLLSDNNGYINTGHGFIGGISPAASAAAAAATVAGANVNQMHLGIDNMFGAVSADLQREGGSPISTSGSSNYSNMDEHRGKRPKSAVYTYPDGHPTDAGIPASMPAAGPGQEGFNLDRSLVEKFLSSAGVAELLNNCNSHMQTDNNAEPECALSDMYESEDEDIEDCGSDESDDDEDEEEMSEHEDEPHANTENASAVSVAADTSVLALGQQSMACTLQGLGVMTANYSYAPTAQPMAAAGFEPDGGLQQFYGAMTPAHATPAFRTASMRQDNRQPFFDQTSGLPPTQPYGLHQEMLLSTNNGQVF